MVSVNMMQASHISEGSTEEYWIGEKNTNIKQRLKTNAIQTSYCSYARPVQPGPIQWLGTLSVRTTLLCGD